MNLWLFLTISVIAGVGALVVMVLSGSRNKLKALEIEALNAKNVTIKQEVEEAVKRHVKQQNERIEVLEAIVTDKKYDLNEKLKDL